MSVTDSMTCLSLSRLSISLCHLVCWRRSQRTPGTLTLTTHTHTHSTMHHASIYQSTAMTNYNKLETRPNAGHICIAVDIECNSR